MERRLTTKQAAYLLGRSEKTLRNWRCARKGPSYFSDAGSIFYLESDLKRYNAHSRRIDLENYYRPELPRRIKKTIGA